MSKLPRAHKFIDLSDYGRRPAIWIARSLKNTSVTPVQITLCFFITGLLACLAIYHGQFLLAGLLLILKSVLDAADGELSRVKNTPTYTGRYLDSIADILLNLLFLITVGIIAEQNWTLIFFAFIGIQLQGTLYNYYYVILRNKLKGDVTSRVLETEAPKAMTNENQSTVNNLYRVYNVLYILFDKTIYNLDPSAAHSKPFRAWFMTMVSLYGLGFQLLVMAILMSIGLIHTIIPYFIISTLGIPIVILTRKIVS